MLLLLLIDFLFFNVWRDAKQMEGIPQLNPKNILEIFKYYISHPSVTIVPNALLILIIELIQIAIPAKLQPIKLQLLSILLTWWLSDHSEILKIKPIN